MVNKRLLNAAKPNAKPHMGVGNCFSNLAYIVMHSLHSLLSTMLLVYYVLK
ncbi:hypothetical protein DOD24_0543 [Staphylococcus arlettae]|nr:hypothetical protein DOD23_1303 [Staphylococcus arlettae]RBA03186.1 hypothetical protein DOD22_1843 [Staphylococcus arlettae]RBA07895.1 hypothetical protein DOD24_0543 [Staphylococcus arlettae]